MADISTHDRDGADAHAVDLGEDRRHVDAVAAAELHLAAAYGGAEYVHGREEVVAHLVDALADLGEDQDDDVRPASARWLPFFLAASPTAPSSIFETSFCPSIRVSMPLARAVRDQALDQPGAGRVHPAHLGKVDDQRAEAVARREWPASPCRQARPGASSSCRQAGRPVRPLSSRISTRGSRFGAGPSPRPSPVPASGWALINMMNRLNPSRHGCHFDRRAFGPFRSR